MKDDRICFQLSEIMEQWTRRLSSSSPGRAIMKLVSPPTDTIMNIQYIFSVKWSAWDCTHFRLSLLTAGITYAFTGYCTHRSSWNFLNLEDCKRSVLLCCNNIDILEETPNRRKDSSVPDERVKVISTVCRLVVFAWFDFEYKAQRRNLK